MQGKSGRGNVSESFGAKIFAPMKRVGLHVEIVCAPLSVCGKGVDVLAVYAPGKEDEAEEVCAMVMRQRMRDALGGAWRAGRGGERV